MSQTLFVRDRGKVLGPFSLPQLHDLKRSGQLRRFHEISADKRVWTPASQFTDLFPPDGPAVAPPPAAPTAAPVPAAGVELVAVAAPPRRPRPKTSVLTWLVIGGMLLGGLSLTALAVVLLLARGGPAGDPVSPALSGDDALGEAVGLVVTGSEIRKEDGTTFEAQEMPKFVKDGKGNLVLSNAAGTGSCFAVTPDGYLVTNRHVIEEADKYPNSVDVQSRLYERLKLRVKPKVWVFFGKGRKFEAKIVHVSSKYDMGVLKIERANGPWLPLSGEAKLPRNTPVKACGFPGVASEHEFGEEDRANAQLLGRYRHGAKVESTMKEREFEFSLTTGTVSRVIKEEGSPRQWVQHTAQIRHGNSGGPLLDDAGRVVAINTQGIAELVAAIGEDGQGNARVKQKVIVDGSAGYSAPLAQMRPEIDRYAPGAAWK